MSRLFVVRHGQASAGEVDYDRLSPLGHRQARLLGARWAARRFAPDRVLVGPRRRHRETLEEVVAAYAEAGRAELLPEAALDDDLDEYAALAMLQRAVPMVLAGESFASLTALYREGTDPRRVTALFEQVTRRWVRGELPVPEVEPWGAFRSRVERALRRVVDDPGIGRGAVVVAFTSAGPSACAAALALGLDDERTFELSRRVRNSAFCEILWSGGRLGLGSYNECPHLDDPALETTF